MHSFFLRAYFGQGIGPSERGFFESQMVSDAIESAYVGYSWWSGGDVSVWLVITQRDPKTQQITV